MTVQIKAPAMGESIAEAVVAKWLVAEGAMVAADQLVAELETDKVNLEVTAPAAGKLLKIATPKGSTVKVGQVMGEIDPLAASAPSGAPASQAVSSYSEVKMEERVAKSGPAVQKLVAEGASVPVVGSGKDGRVTKGDIVAGGQGTGGQVVVQPKVIAPVVVAPKVAVVTGGGDERVPMSRIRKTIATRLKQAQNTAAMLTTYNEVDLSRVNALRGQFKESFEKKHGVKLGYMGFFTLAVVNALREFPALNAEIDGDEIVYKHHHHIGVAVSSDKGLVVPVLRHAGSKTLAEIEREIADMGNRARKGGLQPDELAGGTFSITNGGVFGSLMSMPILNYPQVGILGMHAIKERPVAVDGQVVIRPMMYVALTYDHRIVDGREAVGFLVRVKECLEEPARLLGL